jgi:hypothetical protein
MDGRETDEEYPIVGSPANPRGSIFVYPSQAVPSNTCFPSGLRMALRKQMVRGNPVITPIHRPDHRLGH